MGKKSRRHRNGRAREKKTLEATKERVDSNIFRDEAEEMNVLGRNLERETPREILGATNDDKVVEVKDEDTKDGKTRIVVPIPRGVDPETFDNFIKLKFADDPELRSKVNFLGVMDMKETSNGPTEETNQEKKSIQDITTQLQNSGMNVIPIVHPPVVDKDRDSSSDSDDDDEGPKEVRANYGVVKICEMQDADIEEYINKNLVVKAAPNIFSSGGYYADGPMQSKKGMKGKIINDLKREYLKATAKEVEQSLPGFKAILMPRAGDGVGRGRPYFVDEISPWMEYCANCYSGVVAYDDADAFCISSPRFDCANCHKVWYCSPECQSEHWKYHKNRCNSSITRKEWKRQARQWEKENWQLLYKEKYRMKYHEDMMKIENKVYIKSKN